MKKLIKKILRESDWDFVTQFEPSEEMFHGATEISGKGWLWKVNDFDTWSELYDNLQSINRFNAKWSIKPSIERSPEFFDIYRKSYGELNVFLSYDKENVFIWFGDMPAAVDKNDKPVRKPI
jgi:hypothetical protein